MSDEGERFTIPLNFIRSLSRADWDVLFENGGYLNAEQCARLWRMQDWQEEPPETMQLMVSREEVLRVFPPRKRKRMWRP